MMTFIDFFLHLDKHLVELVQNYGTTTYGILFLIIFCETGLVVTPILPGDSLLFATGAISSLGSLNIHLMVILLIVAAILGDGLNYWIGSKLGMKVFENKNSRIFKQEYLQKTQRFYDRYGGKTIVIARFVPIVRTFAPFLAGIGSMPYSKFALYNITGAILWITSITYAGYFFAEHEFVKKNFSLVILAIIIVSLIPAVIEFIRAYYQDRGKSTSAGSSG